MVDHVKVKFKCRNCGTTQEKPVTWGRDSAVQLPEQKGDRVMGIVICQKCGHWQLVLT